MLDDSSYMRYYKQEDNEGNIMGVDHLAIRQTFFLTKKSFCRRSEIGTHVLSKPVVFCVCPFFTYAIGIVLNEF